MSFLEPLEFAGKILVVGLVVLAVGACVTALGWNMYQHSVPGGDVPTFSSWLVDVFGNLLTLTLSGSDLGEHIAEIGVVVGAIGAGTVAFGLWVLIAQLGYMIDPSAQ